jgi:hypothetical protein
VHGRLGVLDGPSRRAVVRVQDGDAGACGDDHLGLAVLAGDGGLDAVQEAADPIQDGRRVVKSLEEG